MRLALACLLTLTATSAHAADPKEPEGAYEGRALPDVVKRLIWEKSCDVVQKKSVDCSKERCIFKDSKGEGFEPDMQPWQHVLMYEWAVGGNAVQPAMVEGKLAAEDEVTDPRTAFSLLSGLKLDLNPDDYMMQLNPALVRWVARELIPPADTPMCGVTARDVYAQGFALPIRQAVDVYAKLKAKGMTKNVKLAELDKNFNMQRGRFASTCDGMAKKSPDDEKWGRTMVCWWWLRRAATTGTDDLALLFSKVLAEYDPDAHKTFAKVFPKPPVVKVPKTTKGPTF